jgi:hypothetical protein
VPHSPGRGLLDCRHLPLRRVASGLELIADRGSRKGAAAHHPIRMNIYARPRERRRRAEPRRDSPSTTRFHAASVPAPLRDAANEPPGADYGGRAEQHAPPDDQLGSRFQARHPAAARAATADPCPRSRSLRAHSQLRRWLPAGLGRERREVSAAGGLLPGGATRLDDRPRLAAGQMVRAPRQAPAYSDRSIAPIRRSQPRRLPGPRTDGRCSATPCGSTRRAQPAGRHGSPRLLPRPRRS